MRNIKLLLEYDGTGFAGWQRQLNGKSIQGNVEDVLFAILQEKVNVIGAGRTDAGVHARGQVANFRTNAGLGLGEIRNALAAQLPAEIVLRELEEVPFDFHARYSARERTYSYLITRQRSAFLRNHSWHLSYTMDVDLMKNAATEILGSHDFESFCKSNSEVTDYQCTVTSSGWSLDDSKLLYQISANRFLHNMVRALVGTMVDVGRGYTSPQEFSGILEKKDRKEAGMTAPAMGLVLESVAY